MIYCEAYKCTLREDLCLFYQEEARKHESGLVFVGTSDARARVIDRSKCIHCSGGVLQTIREEHNEKEEGIMGECLMPECKATVKAQGLCGPHYDKWRKGNKDVVDIMGQPFKVIRKFKPRAKPSQVIGPSVKTKAGNNPPKEDKKNREVPVPPFEAHLIEVMAQRFNQSFERCFIEVIRAGILGAMELPRSTKE